ncbi:MAG: hypothetical protein ACLFTQ_01075, partial [Candidatus Aenigmatarchaeota archaeon]
MQKEFYLLDVDYEDAERKVDGKKKKIADIRLVGKTGEGESVLAVDRDFDPYFYAVPQKNLEDVREKIKDIDENGVKVKKVEEVEKLLGKEGKEVKALKIFS